MKFAVLSFVALCILPLSASATTVFTDGFQMGTPSLSVTTAGNFTAIDGTNVDLLGGGLYGYLCTPTTSQCVDLDGTGGNPEGVLQSNTTFGAGTYDLSFLITGSGRGNTNTVEVSLGSFDSFYTLGSTDPENIVNQLVTVTTPGALVITSHTPGEVGATIDTVSVSTAGGVAATPEPSSLVLLGSAALTGFRFVLKRRWA